MVYKYIFLILLGLVPHLAQAAIEGDDRLFIYADETGGSCGEVGVWDFESKTCTLTQNVSRPVRIVGREITLDGSGYTIEGEGGGIGVYVSPSYGVTIKNTTVTGYKRALLFVGDRFPSGPRNNKHTVFNNTLIGIENGLHLSYVGNVTVTDNVIRADGNSAALWLFRSQSIQVENNEISGKAASVGITFHSDDNQVVNNTITAERMGIAIDNSSRNKIYSNEIIYPAGAKEPAWVRSPKSRDNIFSTEDGGNRWEGYDEPAEGCVDASGDGFCDTPFNIPGTNPYQDLKPLTKAGKVNAVRQPIIIIPGLVASHSRQCILKDKECSLGGDWGFTPSVNWFDALIARLEGEGYVRGTDLFVAFYDWRNPNTDAAKKYLEPLIDIAQERSGAEKVDIVAHSMGGLVARAYAQSNYYEGDVDQLIMLGTPNEGAADAYLVWEGGQFPERWHWLAQGWIKRIDRALQRVRDESKDSPRSYRTFFPSLRDLLPVKSFLSRSGEDLNAAAPDMVPDNINVFLNNLRSSEYLLADRGIEVFTIAGTGKQTLGRFTLDTKANLSLTDITAERWRDGKASPNPPQPDSILGDQTVLVDSASAVGALLKTVNATHEELPSNNEVQKTVIATLTKNENPKVDYVPTKLASSVIGIDILSPVMPVLLLPDGSEVTVDTVDAYPNIYIDYDPADPTGPKMITIVDVLPGQYTVDLRAMEEKGKYTVIASYADKNDLIFEEYSGDTTVEEPKDFSFTVSSGTAVINLPDVIEGDKSDTENSSDGDTDCCPGVDPEDSIVQKRAGKVLGITTKKADPWLKLKPINTLFRSAFERNPTYDEWLYWAQRLLTDKPQHDALLGAMQWQVIH